MSAGANNSESRQSLDPLDAMRAAPDHHRLILENDRVRVLDTRIGPGDQTPVHSHSWPGTLYVLSWSDFIRYDPDGNVLLNSRTADSRPEPGSAFWIGPLAPHFTRNIGDTELRVIAVELKGS